MPTRYYRIEEVPGARLPVLRCCGLSWTTASSL